MAKNNFFIIVFVALLFSSFATQAFAAEVYCNPFLKNEDKSKCIEKSGNKPNCHDCAGKCAFERAACYNKSQSEYSVDAKLEARRICINIYGSCVNQCKSNCSN